MKKTMLGLALVASMTAQAQSSTTSLSATATAAPAEQTVTTSLKDAGGLRKKIVGTAYFNLIADAAPVNDAEARKSVTVSSENFLQLGYKLTDTTKILIRHNFVWEMAGAENGKYTLIDPALIYAMQGPKLGAFEPMAMSFSYYVPVSETSRTDKRAGALRADISADYNLSPKVTMGLFTSPRLTLNTTRNEANFRGSDSSLRFIGGGSATYNFSDKLSAYYSPYVDFATTQHNRGTIQANVDSGVTGMKGQKWNNMAHEIGMGLNVTKEISVTPAVINYVSMNDGQGFAREEMLEYDLYLSAAF